MDQKTHAFFSGLSTGIVTGNLVDRLYIQSWFIIFLQTRTHDASGQSSVNSHLRVTSDPLSNSFALLTMCEIVKKQGTVVDRPITGRNISPHNGKTVLSHKYYQQTGVTLLHRFMQTQKSTTVSRYISVTTVQRRLLEVGLKDYRARKKPRLTCVHRQRRMEFAQAYHHWTASDWSKVVFSDESRFLLSCT